MTGLPSTSQGDIEETTLLLQLLPHIAHLRGEEIFLQAYDEDVSEL